VLLKTLGNIGSSHSNGTIKIRKK